MLCGISGEAPQEPVASKKSGAIYEKRLIEKYINEHGTEPGTGEALTADHLLPLNSLRIVRPRPPTLTSIPALLATFQNEWDSIALETYNLREQLARTREELATALYQHDAAIRVIARLTRERNEARDSLSRVTVASSSANGDNMAVDTEGLPEVLAARVDAVHQELSKTRKKRPAPKDWVSADQVVAFEVLTTTALPIAQTTCLDTGGTHAVIGGLQGQAAIYSINDDALESEISVGDPITSTLWTGSKLLFGTSSGGVKIFEGGNQLAAVSEHSGPTTDLAIHPSGDIIGSVGADKSLVFYDMPSLQRVSRTFVDASLTTVEFHPDGHLVAVGAVTGNVNLYMTKTLEQAAVFKLGAAIQALTFSENGFWLAATSKGQNSVTVFDLRKEGDAATAKVLQTGGAVLSLAWDYTGQFLATAGPSGLTIQQYAKGAKKWSEPFRNATAAAAVRWGEHGKTLVIANEEGVLSVFGVKV